MDNFRDPATEVINSDNRHHICSLGPIQPRFEFPATLASNGKTYRFQASWYGDKPWLEYSKSTDKAYCYYCRIFASLVGCAEDEFIRNGFSHWKNASGVTGKLNKHASSRAHLLSTERFRSFCTSKPIDAQLSSAKAAEMCKLEKEKLENRQVVECLFDCVRHLGTLSLAFRGNSIRSTCDECDERIVTESGNFTATVQFLAKYYPPLQRWLQNHPGNVNYLSGTTQNNMISIIAASILDEISKQVVSAEWFSVCADETADSSNIEQVSIILRYVHEGCVYESFVGVSPATSLKGVAIADIIFSKLEQLKLQVTKLVGQCYDGASSMRGQHSGVQKIVADAAGKQAIYVWCWAHCLNLVLEDCAKTNILVQRVFGILQQLYVFIERSPMRHREYLQQIQVGKAANAAAECQGGPLLLQSLSETRWSARFKNLRIIDRSLPEIIKTLEILSSKDDDAKMLLKAVSNFDIIFGIKMLRLIFGYANDVSEYLQRDDIDLLCAVDRVNALRVTINECRNNEKFDNIWQETEMLCKSTGIEFELPQSKRARKASKVLTDYFTFEPMTSVQTTAVPNDQAEFAETFRVQYYYATLDKVLSEIDARFGSQATDAMRLMNVMCIWKERQSDDTNDVRQLANLYGLDEDVCVDQYNLLRNDPSAKNVTSLRQLVDRMYKEKMHLVYNQLYKLACAIVTVPVTSAGCERSFSKLSLIKNNLRSCTSNDRLSDLLVMSVEKNGADSLDLAKLVDIFALQPRKLKL